MCDSVKEKINVDIMNSVDKAILEENFGRVNEKFYEHKFCNQVDGFIGICQRVSFHTNRVCRLSIADNHPIIKEDKNVISINCVISNTLDRTKNYLKGKGKKGAQKLNPCSVICIVKCDDGSIYEIYSCVQGKLLEINAGLFEHPSLLKTRPLSEGYIALILPVLAKYETTKNMLLSYEDYSRL